jgi:molybdate-binding protein/DNA-binding transcriptional regulator YhcF (GntR family)
MTLNFQLDASLSAPLYEQLVAAIRTNIVNGALRPGDRLPTVRALAAQLAINQNTIVRAYNLLRAEGLIEAHSSQGTRVARGVSASASAMRANDLRALAMQLVSDGIARGYAPAELEAAFIAQLARWRAENAGESANVLTRGTVIGMGSNDLSLELLTEQFQQLHPDARILVNDVGSLPGLIALGRGEAHFAASHLIDPESGDYNIPILRRLFPQQSFALVTLASRAQGLIVPAGNPKRIKAAKDLARRGVRIANRQRGSGTRAMLDDMLRRARIAPAHVRGYEREERTHAAVAAAVAHGSADTGLGIMAAAQAFGLGFVPLGSERFELVLPLGHSLVTQLVEAIKRPEFQRAVTALGGYDMANAGQLRTLSGKARSV